MTTVHDFSAQTISGDTRALSDFDGQVMLIVNTASKCGFTPQFKGLETLYEKYKEKGFVVLGFPCNQFLSQDPGSNEEISQFCTLNYGVSFPMFAKIDVNGSDAHPLYQYLTKVSPGALGIKAIKWNFTKFLVNKQGQVVGRYAPTQTPKDLVQDIEKLL
jgi:glutathione peroxidase